MDWRDTNFALDYLASSGTVFSVEQRMALQASLTILQQENKFNTVHFIAKINGTLKDYYVCCGFGKDILKDRTYFYSMNKGMDWILLPLPKESNVQLALSCKGHFVGDPAADCETDMDSQPIYEVEEDGDWITIKEEDRLAGTIIALMSEAAIIPRGALIKSPTGVVSENKMFGGLSKLNATQLHSYYHMRRPLNPWDRNIVARADYNLTLDFLDSIACDIPVGCWALQLDRFETTVYARSLYWPGLIAFHVIDKPKWGFLYVGTGKKNWDVPFMILPPPMGVKASVVEGGGDFTFDGENEEEEEEDDGEFPYESGPNAAPYVPQEMLMGEDE